MRKCMLRGFALAQGLVPLCFGVLGTLGAIGGCGGGAPHPGPPGDAALDAGSDTGPPMFAATDAPGPIDPTVCAPNVGNFDIPGNGCDDDADGRVDNAPACDDGSLPVGGTGLEFVRSMALCQTIANASDPRWGVLSAEYSAGYFSAAPPNAAQHGILPKFGTRVVPREGHSLGVLSTGYAREYDSMNGADPFKGLKEPMQGATVDAAPPGYPKTSIGCPLLDRATFDLVNVKIVMKVPRNAQGFSFDFDFWSGEWPEYVCTPYNDTFIAYLHSRAFNGASPENISFDARQDTVSVNNGFFDRCTPNTQTGCKGGSLATATCPGQEGELAGTGFSAPGNYCSGMSSGGGATGWLTSSAPVAPGETITLEFMIWDTGDPNWDSSVLLDHFQWTALPVTTGTERPK